MTLAMEPDGLVREPRAVRDPLPVGPLVRDAFGRKEDLQAITDDLLGLVAKEPLGSRVPGGDLSRQLLPADRSR